MKSSSSVLILALAVFVGACGSEDSIESNLALATAEADTATGGASTGVAMGPNSGMMQRHQATIPVEYAGLTNPVVADEESLARGAAAFTTCAVCHGETGLGDGTAGAVLNPAPANIAHTSQMMGDDYFFWRISEGGAQFSSAMPAWKDALDEQTRWDLINYVQALGAGTAMSGGGMGMGMGMGQGQGTNAQAQAVQQAALLQVAVDQAVITQVESDLFTTVHPTVDAKVTELRGTSSGATMLTDALAQLVASGDLTQDQADAFQSIHDRLGAAGLLP